MWHFPSEEHRENCSTENLFNRGLRSKYRDVKLRRSIVKGGDASVPRQAPLLAAVADQLTRSPLMTFQTSSVRLSSKHGQYCNELLQQRSCVADQPADGCHALTIDMNPANIAASEVTLVRAPPHRPTPAEYRTAFTRYLLYLLREISRVNGADGLGVDPLGPMGQFFPTHSEPAIAKPTKHDFIDDARLLTSCIRHLPASTMSIRRISMRKAVVLLCFPGETPDTSPTFQCIAGWGRWSTLRALTECVIQRGGSFPTYKRALAITVPVYILDGSGITNEEIICLSTYFNCLDGQCSADNAVPKIRSRPISLYDRFWTLQTLLTSVDPMSDATVSQVIQEKLQESENLDEYRAWLEDEGQLLSESSWMKNPLVCPFDNQASNDATRLLISFMVSLYWNLTFETIHTLSCRQLCKMLGTTDVSRMGHPQAEAFWDDVFMHHIPYQVQLSYSLSDLMGCVRSFENFFLSRSKRFSGAVSKLKWTISEERSLLLNAAKHEPTMVFAKRITAKSELKTLDKKAPTWGFESLSAFVCYYNLQTFIECEAGTIHDDCIPDSPKEPLDDGAMRTLSLLRAIVITACLTFDSPALLFEYMRQQGKDNHSPFRLSSTSKADIECINRVCFVEDREGLKEPDVGVEESFEILIGVLTELVFRILWMGLSRLDPFTPRDVDSTLAKRSLLHEATKPRQVEDIFNCLKAGSVPIQVFIRQCQRRGTSALLTNTDSPIAAEIPVPDVFASRPRAYELMPHLQQTVASPQRTSQYRFIWIFMEKLISVPASQAMAQAAGLLCRKQPFEGVSGESDEGRKISRPSAECSGQERLMAWLSDRKTESNAFVANLLRLMKQTSDSSKPVVVCAMDFRGMTPAEVKQKAGYASDCANVSASLKEVPYRLEVQNVSALSFAKTALDNVCQQVETTLQSHLQDGLQQLLSVHDSDHSVVASARPGVLCALWQTLLCISPFFDVQHPLAVEWHKLRADFCSWLWEMLRGRLQTFWQLLCQDHIKLGPIPTLRWSMRILPATGDGENATNLPDLTGERLRLLLSPKVLDRTGAAFYRFVYAGLMSSPKTAGGHSIESLDHVFSSPEAGIRELFVPVWETFPFSVTIEEALSHPEVAVAGFLKRYAMHVLSTLESSDRSLSPVRSTPGDDGEKKHPLEAKLLTRGRKRVERDENGTVDLDALPLSMKAKLSQTIPDLSLFSIFSERFARVRSGALAEAGNRVKRRRKCRDSPAADEQMFYNGAFPSLPSFFEEISAAWARRSPLIGGLYPQGTRLLPPERRPLHPLERTLVDAVLACIASRGIDMLYSSATNECFTSYPEHRPKRLWTFLDGYAIQSNILSADNPVVNGGKTNNDVQCLTDALET